jgi:ribokinase
MKPRIAVVGSYAVGMTMSCSRFPKNGETVKGSGFKILHGGKGSNQAIAAARLGGHTIFGGCVGNDQFGTAALEMLERESIDVSFVKKSPEASTGVGFVVVDESGNNEIVIDLGANNLLCPEDIDTMSGAIAGCGILLVQLEANVEAVVRSMEIAHKHGLLTILNPAPYQPIPDSVVKLASIITPNETEAAEMLGLGRGASLSGRELAGKLYEKFGVTAVVTLGRDGAHIRSSDIDETTLPTYEIEVVDTTGAGDTFSAALAVGLGEGRDLRSAVDFANKAASHSVAVAGVVESIPTRDTVNSVQLKINRRS